MPSSKLVVTVVAGRDLAPKDSNGLSDPYVYVWTVPELHSKTRCKSKTIYKSLNPQWDETFEFEVDTSNPDGELLVQVWDYDRFASDDFMGTIAIPLHSFVGKKEVDEWYTLQARPNKKDDISGDIRVRSQLKTNEENESISLETKERDKRFIDIVDPDVLKKLDPKERKRQEIIFELINTEELYVNDLKVIINSFMTPLEEKKLVSPPELANLFSNVKAILPVNEALLASFQAKQKKNPVIDTIGDVLLQHVDALRVYNVYCSNQTVATEKVDEYRNAYPAFATFIDQPRDECRRLPLTGFLVKPLQRLCKYPLLVRELLKDLPASHADYKHLSATNEKVKAIIDDANERTRQVEQLVKLQTIRELFAKSGCNEILKGGRQFVMEARATLVKNGEKSVEVLAILFNDMCFLSKQKRDTLSKVAELPLNVVSIRGIPNTADTSCLIEFRLVNDAWVLEMNTEEEKATWLAKVEEKKAVALYEDIMKHGGGIPAGEDDIPSVQSLMESGGDMKIKLVALLERVKKERSLRVLSEKSLVDARQQLKALTQANELLQGQLDQAVSSFASLERSSSSGGLLSVKSESVDHISRNKSPLAFKNPLRSVAKPLLQASSDSQIKRKKDMELAPPGGGRARVPSSDRSASPTVSVTAVGAGAAGEMEEKLRLEKKKAKRLQVRLEEMNDIVKELKAGKDGLLEERNRLLGEALQTKEAVKPAEYLKDQVTALARQNETLEKRIRELEAGGPAPKAASTTAAAANSDVMEALRREVTSLRKENETVQELQKKIKDLEQQLDGADAAPAISVSVSASPKAAPRASPKAAPVKASPAKASPKVAASAKLVASSTAKTQTSSGKTLDVLRPVGSRSKTPAGNVSSYKSRNASLTTPTSPSPSARSVTPVLRPPGYKGDEKKKAGGPRPSVADRMRAFEK